MFGRPGNIDLILGVRQISHFMLNKTFASRSLLFQETKFGFIAKGSGVVVSTAIHLLDVTAESVNMRKLCRCFGQEIKTDGKDEVAEEFVKAKLKIDDSTTPTKRSAFSTVARIFDLAPNMINRYTQVQRSFQCFWKKWSLNYLDELKMLAKWIVIEAENPPADLQADGGKKKHSDDDEVAASDEYSRDDARESYETERKSKAKSK